MEAKKFVNFTNENFTWSWDGMAYTFKPNEPMFLEDYKANHFAKHLVDKELNRIGVATNNMAERARLEKLCFPSDEVVTPLEALNIEETKKVAKKKAKVVEVEFEDLNKK